ncbi:hypothetical protein Y1Q_0021657 [Alligator mississippiensis]|uniref:Formamidopyrimidine-DNA glycosylase catalytic domain-containing protein n=1 Tax=Alligator mississippiensis TaxID=8496 RepID=A0A151PAS6_ALLMI|nr:hypothetical protein Y1Q_0021657 [Alligator mississippiensis]
MTNQLIMSNVFQGPKYLLIPYSEGKLQFNGRLGLNNKELIKQGSSMQFYHSKEFGQNSSSGEFKKD